MALVLVLLGAQNIFAAQAFGIAEFPRYVSWLLMIGGVYVGFIPFVRAPRDLGSSFVLVIIGATALYFGAELTMGTAGRMGPGYFPRLLAWLIIAIGIFLGLMSLSNEGPPISPPQFRPLVFVLGSISIFGYLMDVIGLAVTAVVIVLIAALARPQFKMRESLLLGIGLSIGTVLIFVYALGQSLPDCPDGMRCTQWLPQKVWGGF